MQGFRGFGASLVVNCKTQCLSCGGCGDWGDEISDFWQPNSYDIPIPAIVFSLLCLIVVPGPNNVHFLRILRRLIMPAPLILLFQAFELPNII